MIPRKLRWVIGVVAACALAGALATTTRAQIPGARFPTEISAIRHNSGQAVVPYFEGWIRNADGTFDLVFGYFNRNFVEEFAIPAGPDNKIEPGSMEQGQPTYFLPRRQRYVYRVGVPADFGKKELIWSITANGRTERAYGSLLPPQEISERVVMTNGNYDPGLDDPNKPPSITIAPPSKVTVGTPVTLTALVTDDGLPKVKPLAPAPRDPKTTTGGFGGQVNTSANGGSRELRVTWLQYSGPAKVTFGRAEAVPVTNGQAVTTATFTAPGSYRLIVSAADPGRLSTKTNLTVTVP